MNDSEKVANIIRLLDTIRYIQSYIEDRYVCVTSKSIIKAITPDATIENNMVYYDGICFYVVPDEMLPDANQVYVLKYKNLFRPSILYELEEECYEC